MENYFCVRHKSRQKHKRHFKLLFIQTKFTFRYIKLSIFMQEIKFTSQKEYIIGRLFSRNAKKTHTDQSTLQNFYSVQIETTHNHSKVAAAKNISFSVYIADTFDECFFLQCDKLFFIKVCCYFEIFSTAILLLSLKQVF